MEGTLKLQTNVPEVIALSSPKACRCNRSTRAIR